MGCHTGFHAYQRLSGGKQSDNKEKISINSLQTCSRNMDMPSNSLRRTFINETTKFTLKRRGAKMMYVTRYKAFEWLVLPFKLTNTAATFWTLMNNIFHPYLDMFIVFYLYYIVNYNNIMEEHWELQKSFPSPTREQDLYKAEEILVFQHEVHLLDDVIAKIDCVWTRIRQGISNLKLKQIL